MKESNQNCVFKSKLFGVKPTSSVSCPRGYFRKIQAANQRQAVQLSAQFEATDLEPLAAPGSAPPERFQERGWAGGLPGTAGLWPESDPAGSSSDRLSL